MLGGLALKRRWQQRRAAEGKPADKPNIVMGINVQVCWEKFANYWDVEMRLVPMEGERFTSSAEEAVKLCDENTIGVVAILGSTFDGAYEPVKEICDALDELRRRPGSTSRCTSTAPRAAFIAPFLDPDLEWDFRLPRVASINTSGHKYGLVYPGVGWVVWRDADALPDDLIFQVNYLGDDMPTFALNFSRPGAQVVAQYYNFLRLGFEGYRARAAATRATSPRASSAQIAELGPFRAAHPRRRAAGVRLHARQTTSTTSPCSTSRTRMRERGWLVPAYTFPANRDDLGGAAGGRAARLHARHGRHAADRPAAAAAAAAGAARAGAHDGGARVPPLTPRSPHRLCP